MPNAVDERIVAAKFDASDFEKGVDKTIKKLDELKKSLDFKEATKGVKELAEKTEVSTDSMSKSLEKLTDRFTTFTGMIKQKILGGLADEVAGVFLRMEQSVKSFIKAISTDQISTGMSKYEQILTSVRVMMSAGKSQDDSYAAIKSLQTYSDQTSYSLNQMTDAMSKMVGAGVDLEVARKSVEGIANACADAGINAMDAQRAFYNLAQAYGKGTLNYTDYRSLEMLNMTTEKMRKNMLEAAVEAKTLKKVSDGVYQTINSEDKKVKAGKKVTIDNMTDMLRYDFMNKNAMNILFGKKFFFDEEVFEEYKKKYKDPITKSLDESGRQKAIEDAKKDYGETAVNAYLAAREARNFTDALNTLKDVVSTGWAKSFEYLFGKLEDAKDFFTRLVDDDSPLANVIYKISEYRNALLGYWDSVDAAGNSSGGQVFRQTILNIAEALGTLFRTFLQILPGFDELENEEGETKDVLESLGDKMYIVSMKIRDLSERAIEAARNFNIFMNSSIVENGPTRIELIRQTISNLASVFSIIGKVVVLALNAMSRAFYTLSPIFDGVLQILEKITEPIAKLKKDQKVFNDLSYSVDNILTILKPIAETLGNILGFLSGVAGFFAQMALDTVTMNISFFSDALGLLLELFTHNSSQLKNGEGILNSIRDDFEGIKTACKEGLTTVKTFFVTLLDDLKKLFGLTEQAEGETEKGGVFAGLANFFDTNEFVQKAKNWVNKAIVDIGDFIKSIPSKVREFGANIYTTIRNLLFKDEKVTKDGKEETQTVLTPLGEWLDNVIKDIKAFVVSIPQRIIDGVGKVGNWIDTIFNSLFGEKPVEKADKTNSADQAKEETISQFDQFVQETVASIKGWFEDLPNKIRRGLASIGNFFTRLFGAINEFLFGKKVTKVIKRVNPLTGQTEFVKTVTMTYKKGFSKWLDGVIKDVKKFIANIPEYIKAGIQGAGDIITTIINALFGKTDNSKTAGNELQEKLEEPFLKIDLSNILAKLKEIGETILNQIARIFTGSDDLEYNEQWFANKIAEGIEWIRTKASLALNWVLEFLITLPTKIANLFNGEGKDTSEQEKGPIGQAISGFAKSIGEFIEGLPNKILEFVNNAIDLIGDVWDKFYNGIINGSKEQNEKVSKYAEDELGYPKSFSHRTHKSGWEKFVENLGKTITHAFEELPIWVANGIELAVKSLDDLIQNLGIWISGIGENIDAKGEASEALSTVANDVGDGAKNGLDSGEPKLITAIKNIGERIGNLFTQTIPTFINDAWGTIFGVGSQIWDGIVSLFTGETPNGGIAQAVNALGVSLYNFITKDIPGFIQSAFNFIGKLFNGEDVKTLTDEEIVASAKQASRTVGKVDEAMKKEADSQGLGGFFDTIKTKITEGFSNIGPAILEGLRNALAWIGNIFTVVGDFLVGGGTIKEKVDKNFAGESFEFRDALTQVGENLYKLFVEIIPKFIGRAIGSVISTASEMFGNLYSGLGEAMEESAGEANNSSNSSNTNDPKWKKDFEKKMEGATQTVNSVGDFINKFVNQVDLGQLTDTVAVVAGLLIMLKILEIIEKITSVANVSGNMADRAEAKNSIEAVFKRGLTLLIAGMALAAYASTLDKRQFKQAKEMFGLIKDLAQTMMGMYTVSKGFEAFSDITESISDMTLGSKKLAKSAQESLKNMQSAGDIAAKGFGQGLSTFGKGMGASGAIVMVGSAVDTVLDEIINNFSTIGSVFAGLAENIKTAVNKLNEVKDTIDTAIEVFGKAIQIAEMFPTLAKYKQDSTDASETMTGISGGLANFVQAVSGKDIHAKEVVDAIDQLIQMKDKMIEFVNFASEGSTFDEFKYAIASLGSAFSLFGDTGEFKIPSQEYISSIISAVIQMLGNEDVIGLAGNLKGSSFTSSEEAYKYAESMIIFANALKRLAVASVGLNEQSGEYINGFIQAVGKIDMTPLQKDGGVTSIADQLSQLAVSLGTFASNTSGLTMENVQTAEYAINILSQLAYSIKDAGQGWLEKAFLGESDLNTFATGIRNVGGGLGDFFKAIEGLSDTNKVPIKHDYRTLEIAGMLVQDLAHAFRIFGEDDKAINPERVSKAVEKFQTVAQNLKLFMLELNDPENWTEGGFNVKSISFINEALDIFNQMTDITSKISGIHYMQEKINEFYQTMFGKIDPMGRPTEAKYDQGFFYVLKNLLIAFGSFYSDLKKENNQFGISDKDIVGFYVAVSQMFKAMSYMTSIGFGIPSDSDLFTTLYNTENIEDSYKHIVEILRYFNNNLDVITTFLDNTSTFNSAGVKVAGHFFVAMGDLASAMHLFADMPAINQGLMNLKRFDWNTLSGIVNEMISILNTNILTTENSEKLNEIGSVMAKRIFDGIQAAFDEDQSLRPEITPVLKLEPMKDQLREAFGTDLSGGVQWDKLASAVYGANGETDAERVKATDLYAKLDSVNEHIDALAQAQAKLDDLTGAFTRMGIYINKNVMLGEIADDVTDIVDTRIGIRIGDIEAYRSNGPTRG